MEDLAHRYYLPLAAAFVRGRLELRAEADDEAFRAGTGAGLKLHKFKRNADLPRVRHVLSMLAGLSPASLLDVGSGRGTFLWPLLDAFADLEVTAIDQDPQRAGDLEAVRRGGVARLSAAQMDVTKLAFEPGSFDGVTILEVLEHLPDPARAAREVLRVARRFVVASVPSKPDDNPEHIHLFDHASLTALFMDAGARSVRLDYVRGHAIALAFVGNER